jgi:hypothetical protein
LGLWQISKRRGAVKNWSGLSLTQTFGHIGFNGGDWSDIVVFNQDV